MQQPPASEAPDESIELGFRYPRGGAFVPEEKYSTPKELYDDPAFPSAVPGSRFPHSYLDDVVSSDKPISTIDLVKTNFVLVTIDPYSPWAAAASKAPIEIDVYTLNATSSPYRDIKGNVEKKCRLKPGEAILVRPDGFIGWRGTRVDSGHEEKLKDGINAVLRK